MYAIIEDSGTQIKVSEGDLVRIDLRPPSDVASPIEFARVLLISDGETATVGTPLVDGAKVIAEVVRAKVAGPKLRVFKFKRRKGYRKRAGHRQKYTEVRITEIVA